MAKVYDPDALVGIIEGLGGQVCRDTRTFCFDLPLENVRSVVPKLNELGVGCRKVSEHVADRPYSYGIQSVARIECTRQPEVPKQQSSMEGWLASADPHE
jgi:hypothetical protein